MTALAPPWIDVTDPVASAVWYVRQPAWRQRSTSAFWRRCMSAEWIEAFVAAIERERSPP